MKFLIFLLVIIAVLFVFRQCKKAPIHSTRTKSLQTITMVQCAYCSIHLPEDEAITHNGQHWCSKEHQLLGHKSS